MNLESNKVFIFKLITGEEIVARVEELHQDFLVLSHPITMVVTQQGLQMMPSLFSANIEANVQLNKNSISMATDPREDIADSYRQATTGISVPPRKQIITG
jgi:hypothetical protein